MGPYFKPVDGSVESTKGMDRSLEGTMAAGVSGEVTMKGWINVKSHCVTLEQ